MRSSDTTRIINRLFNYFSSLNINFRSIAEIEITNSHGNTKLDYLVLHIDINNTYYVFELKYNRKNLQDLSNYTGTDLTQVQHEIQRVQSQYLKITNLQNTDWDSTQFPQPIGKIHVIYCFINSLFINEFLSVLNFNSTKDSYFSLDKQGKNFNRGSIEILQFPNASNLISYITTHEEKIVIPFTFQDLDFESSERMPFSKVSRNQGRLLLKLSKSFLLERISTLEKSFTIDEFYDSIFGEIEDRFSFGRVDKANLIRILKKYCKLLSETTYYKERKVLNINGDFCTSALIFGYLTRKLESYIEIYGQRLEHPFLRLKAAVRPFLLLIL